MLFLVPVYAGPVEIPDFSNSQGVQLPGDSFLGGIVVWAGASGVKTGGADFLSGAAMDTAETHFQSESSRGPSADDERYMKIAIDQAFIAEDNGDVPIGCVIVYEGRIVAKAYNQREQLRDPTAHAEIIALTQAAEAVGSWRLHGCTVFVTLEPCPMCAGALVLARVDRLVYGCDDPKTGAVRSLYNIVQDDRLNHRVEVTSGVMAEACTAQLQEFFRRRRSEKRNQTEEI
jgi:tRNA(adenine34) deaminase